MSDRVAKLDNKALQWGLMAGLGDSVYVGQHHECQSQDFMQRASFRSSKGAGERSPLPIAKIIIWQRLLVVPIMDRKVSAKTASSGIIPVLKRASVVRSAMIFVSLDICSGHRAQMAIVGHFRGTRFLRSKISRGRDRSGRPDRGATNLLVALPFARTRLWACRRADTSIHRCAASVDQAQRQVAGRCQWCNPRETHRDCGTIPDIFSAILIRSAIGPAHSQ